MSIDFDELVQDLVSIANIQMQNPIQISSLSNDVNDDNESDVENNETEDVDDEKR